MNPNEQQILEKLQQAREAYASKKYQKAIELYEWVQNQIQDDQTNLPIIWIELGWSYHNLHAFNNCILYLEKALNSSRLTPRQKFDCLRLIGFSWGTIGDNGKALDYLYKSLELKIPEWEKKYVYFEIGKIHFLNGAIKDSKTFFEKASNYFSWDEQNYYQALAYYTGFIAFYEKQFDKAKKLFAEIIEKGTDNKSRATGYFGLAHLLFEEKNNTALIDICKKILELDKNFYDKETISFFLCNSFLELKQYEKLKVFYYELQKKYPDGRYKTYYPIFEKSLPKVKQK